MKRWALAAAAAGALCAVLLIGLDNVLDGPGAATHPPVTVRELASSGGPGGVPGRIASHFAPAGAVTIPPTGASPLVGPVGRDPSDGASGSAGTAETEGPRPHRRRRHRGLRRRSDRADAPAGPRRSSGSAADPGDLVRTWERITPAAEPGPPDGTGWQDERDKSRSDRESRRHDAAAGGRADDSGGDGTD